MNQIKFNIPTDQLRQLLIAHHGAPKDAFVTAMKQWEGSLLVYVAGTGVDEDSTVLVEKLVPEPPKPATEPPPSVSTEEVPVPKETVKRTKTT